MGEVIDFPTGEAIRGTPSAEAGKLMIAGEKLRASADALRDNMRLLSHKLSELAAAGREIEDPLFLGNAVRALQTSHRELLAAADRLFSRSGHLTKQAPKPVHELDV